MSLAASLDVLGHVADVANRGADAATILQQAAAGLGPAIAPAAVGVCARLGDHTLRVGLGGTAQLQTRAAERSDQIVGRDQLVDGDELGGEGAVLFVPLGDETSGVGHLVVTGERGAVEAARAATAAVASVLNLCLARCAEHERARANRRSVALHRARLLDVARQLARPPSPEDVASAVVSAGMAALGASHGALFAEDGNVLRVVAARNYPEAVLREHGTVPVDSSWAVAEAYRSGRPIVCSSLAERRARFPGTTIEALGDVALACVSIGLEERRTGVACFHFDGPRVFSPGEEDFLLALSLLCGEALDRVQLVAEEKRARGTAERARRRSELLVQVGASLSATLEVDDTLRETVEQLVPALADGCCIELLDPDSGQLHHAAHRHVDLRKDGLLAEARQRSRVDAATGQGVAAVLRSGETTWLERIAPADRLEGVIDDDELRQAMGVRSLLIVPLSARGRRLGAMTLLVTESDRCFVADDRQLAEQLASRVALALDNARLYRAEKDAFARASEAERRKDEFLAILGHELRNPLAPILTALELMRMEAPDVFVRERAIMTRQARHLLRLVDDLLDVSRITRGVLSLQRERLEVGGVLAAATEMVAPRAEERGIPIELEAAGPAWVVGDRERLAQVFSNLLLNAVEHGGDQPVRVEVRGDEREVRIAVVDRGAGMDRDAIAQVFAPFEQGAQPLDRTKGGLGLGLTIARRLVELHGGELAASSPGVGHGSRFEVVLPAEAPRAEEVGKEPETEVGRALRVLVVDDNVDAAVILGRVLEQRGHVVALAHDGPGALAEAPRFRPEVALLDIGLPAMDGYELAERLRALPDLADVRLVALTGYGSRRDHRRSERAGFAAHLVKPVGLAALLGVLEDADA